ncbi:MAG: hypothetical protein HKN30_03340 [Sulfitobacter sp.]|nr:hypothetical protein [Sulfitobacter sp.]
MGRGGAMLLAAALALPQSAAACLQLSADVWMCARGSAWEAAKWDPYGDGETLLLGDFVLNFDQNWPTAELRDAASTLEEQYVTYAAWVKDEGIDPKVLRVDRVTLPNTIALRYLQRDEWQGQPVLQANMLAEVGAHRIMLYLDAPGDMKIEMLDATSEEILSLLRDTCADDKSCAKISEDG